MAKSIILKEVGKVINFETKDLPMLIHGAAHAGESLFSITVATNLFLGGRKILFFTAYPMAREELSEQIQGMEKEKDIYYLENISDIKKVSNFKAVIIKSGDSALCLQAIRALSDIGERIIFVKNINSILTKELFAEVIKYQKIILSGDVDQLDFKNELASTPFKTKILFSVPKADLGINVPKLEKYTGFMDGQKSGLVVISSSSLK